jgi:hypothetical protein
MRKFLCVLLTAVGVSGAASAGHAATITETVDFVASNFTSYLGSVAPFSSVTGSITFTLDPTLAYQDETAGIIVNHIDVAYSGAPKFTYDPLSKFLNLGAGVQANGAQGSIPDFQVSLFILDPQYWSGAFTYTMNYPNNDIYSTYDVTFAFTPPLVPTPIPAALPLFAFALGGLGIFGWKRRRNAAAA